MPRESLLVLLSSVLLLGAMAAAQSENRKYTIVVSAWAAAEPDSVVSAQAANAVLSRDFAASAFHAAAQIRYWRMHLAYTIENGYPLSEYWIASDRDGAAGALQLAHRKQPMRQT